MSSEAASAVAGEIATREEGAQRGAVVPVDNGILHPDRWTMFGRIANSLANTSFVPKGLQGKPESALACMLYGDALGLHPSVSLTEIYVIDGRPSISANLMAAKIRQDGHYLRREEVYDPQNPAKIIAIRAHGRRKDGSGEDSYMFSLEMAARADLLKKDNWKKYPEAMMWARACSQLARMLFSDVFLGQSMYVPDELEERAPDLVNGGERTGTAEQGDYGEDAELADRLRAHFEALDFLPAKRVMALEGLDDAGRRVLLSKMEAEATERGLAVRDPEEVIEEAEVEETDEPVGAQAEAEPADVHEPPLSDEDEAEVDRIWKESGAADAEQGTLPMEPPPAAA